MPRIWLTRPSLQLFTRESQYILRFLWISTDRGFLFHPPYHSRQPKGWAKQVSHYSKNGSYLLLVIRIEIQIITSTHFCLWSMIECLIMYKRFLGVWPSIITSSGRRYSASPHCICQTGSHCRFKNLPTTCSCDDLCQAIRKICSSSGFQQCCRAIYNFQKSAEINVWSKYVSNMSNLHHSTRRILF